MPSSLSSLAKNLFKIIHKAECNCRHDNEKCEKCKIKYKDCESYIKYANAKDDLLND